MPHRPANTNSGDSAVPTTTSVRWRPLTSAVSVEPGFRPRLSAKPSDTSTSRLPSLRCAPSRASAAAGERDAVERMRPARIDADELADDGVGQARDLHAHHLLDRGLHLGDAGLRGQLRGERVGRALEAGEQVGEMRIGVEAVARQRQRLHRRQVVMKPPMPLATTSAIVSAWLHSARRSRSSLRFRAFIVRSPAQLGGRELVRVARCAAPCRRPGGSRYRPCRRWRRCA